MSSEEQKIAAEQFAHNVAKTSTMYTGKDVNYTFDIVTITMLVQVIIQIFKVLNALGYSISDIIKLFTNPSSQESAKIESVMKKQIGRIRYWRIGDHLKKSIMQTGQTLEPEQVAKLLG